MSAPDPATLDALRVWAAEARPRAKLLAERRDAECASADRALALVRQFVIDRGLVLFGGVAIDAALRLRGEQLYLDGERPDYDFVSSDSVNDAYDLAEILQAAGFRGVRAIVALHTQTMRVAAEHVWVADIGYAPPAVMAGVPTIAFDGLRLVHPDHQRIDMHLPFAFPFRNAPAADVFNRWGKDAARLRTLNRLYPIVPVPPGDAPLELAHGGFGVPVVADTAAGAAKLRAALHGFAAYAAIREHLAALGGVSDAPRLRLNFPAAAEVAVEVPAGVPRVVLAASPWGREAAPAGAAEHAPYMDVLPRSFAGESAAVLDVGDQLLVAPVVAVPGGFARVVSAHYLMLWLLHQAGLRPAQADTFRAYYAHTLDLVAAAELACAGDPDRFMGSPLGPGLDVMGGANTSPADTIRLAKLSAQVLGTDPTPNLPRPYFMKTDRAGYLKRPAHYDYASSPLFARDGRVVIPAPV
jgi:hypothetical protein